MADEDDFRGLREDREQPQVSLQAAVKAILEGGLGAQIQSVVQQQAALMFGELSRAREAASSSSKAAHVAAVADHDAKRDRQAILIDHFNPEHKDADIERWLDTIDQLGDIYVWTDYDRLNITQAKLAGTARTWYHQLDRYNYTWTQWKSQLKQAFSRRLDFAVMLEEMVNRKKMTGETMTAYYHAKLALCSRVNIKGAPAVSCIIRGLPEELRASAYAAKCSDPEKLYHEFLVGSESYSRVESKRRSDSIGSSRATKKRIAPTPKTSVRCYNCQELGTHLSKDCPKERVERCWTCGKEGHMAKNCPKKRVLYGPGESRVSLTLKPGSVFKQIAHVNGACLH